MNNNLETVCSQIKAFFFWRDTLLHWALCSDQNQMNQDSISEELSKWVP